MSLHKSNVSPTVEIAQLTPEDAVVLLSLNTKNRKIKEHHVTKLTSIMNRGEWRFNGQTIQIADDGRVLDGQHRLLACVRSGVTIETLIMYGADPASQETMDMGVARTTPDILSLRGYKDANALAALAARILTYQSTGLASALSSPGRLITPATIVAYVEGFGGKDRYISLGKKTAKLLRMNPSLVGLLMWITDRVDYEDSIYFWDKLLVGTGLGEGSPILALRDWGLDPSRTRSTDRSNARMEAAVTLKAWNKFRSGEKVVSLRFRAGGAAPETFPVPN
jgi:hypothetical protein